MLFSMSKGFAALVLGRAFVGLGVAAAFTGGLNAIVLWFPKDRVAAMNGWMVMLGALGALSATSPAELLLDWSGGWRGLFAILAAVTVASALTIWVAVPEATSAKPSSNEHTPISLKIIYSDPRFWGLAPLSATCAGTAWALQGLWATPWLTAVDGLPQADVTRHLFIIAIVQGIAALLLGSAADRLRRRGVGPQVLLGFVATTFIAAQLALSSHRCRQRQYASGAANPRSPCGSEPRCRRGTADRRANQDRPWWRSGLCAAQFPQAPCRRFLLNDRNRRPAPYR